MADEHLDLIKVARWQRRAILCILAQLLSIIGFGPVTAWIAPARGDIIGIVVVILFWGIWLLTLISVVALMGALRRHLVWRAVYCVLAFIPLLNLILLLMINGHATRVLNRAGLRVRLLGARHDDVMRVVSASLCAGCGYDLTGNTSGRCPECHAAVQPLFCPHCGNDLRGNTGDLCPGCRMVVPSVRESGMDSAIGQR